MEGGSVLPSAALQTWEDRSLTEASFTAVAWRGQCAREIAKIAVVVMRTDSPDCRGTIIMGIETCEQRSGTWLWFGSARMEPVGKDSLHLTLIPDAARIHLARPDRRGLALDGSKMRDSTDEASMAIEVVSRPHRD